VGGPCQEQVDFFKISAIKAAAAAVSKFAKNLHSEFPKAVPHIVSDSSYIKGLAKRDLLEWTGRDTHSDSSVALFHHRTRLSQDHALLEMSATVQTCIGDYMALTSSILSECSELINIIGDCSCVQELSGETQLTEAHKIMSVKATFDRLPGALKLAVQKLPDMKGKKRKAPTIESID
jgi:hypothetical protein